MISENEKLEAKASKIDVAVLCTKTVDDGLPAIREY